jgi:glycosyltransferase involved in cell wall biosynthesis
MRASRSAPVITIFTPSFADEGNTNAQNLTVKEIVSRLPSERFRVVMLCSETPDPRIAARRNTTLLPYGKHGNAARLMLYLLAAPPDIYFFPREGLLDRAFLFLRRRLGLKSALVTYIVSGGLEQNEWPRARYQNIDDGDTVVANNAYLKELLRRRLDVEASTIYDGVDRRFYYAGTRKPASNLTVLYAGSFRPYKRVDVVIREAAKLPIVRFRIAGVGEEEEHCRRLAQQLDCANVTFLGHLTPSELGDEMRQADIFFFPSIREGHPQVLGQAAACGLPAIAMNSYRPDYVVHGHTGLLAESDHDLAECLQRLSQDERLRSSMAEAATQHALKFDWDQVTLQWTNVFEQAVATAEEREAESRIGALEASRTDESRTRVAF